MDITSSLINHIYTKFLSRCDHYTSSSVIFDKKKTGLVKRFIQQTYECLLFILCPEPVASWEEGVRICCIKPLEVTQVQAEPNLKEADIYTLA